MNGKHTPGPWVVRRIPIFPNLVVFSTGPDGGAQREICGISRPRGDGQSLLDEANAHLIAAAPDMLTALHTLLAWVEGQKLAGVLPEGWNFQYAEDAIAKATGAA